MEEESVPLRSSTGLSLRDPSGKLNRVLLATRNLKISCGGALAFAEFPKSDALEEGVYDNFAKWKQLKVLQEFVPDFEKHWTYFTTGWRGKKGVSYTEAEELARDKRKLRIRNITQLLESLPKARKADSFDDFILTAMELNNAPPEFLDEILARK